MEKGWLSGISIPLYLLVIVFNLASWIDLSAIWTEMPLLVNRLPELWELPAYLNLILNAGRIMSVIVYGVTKKMLKDKLKESRFVYAIIVIGATCLFLTAFFWDRTAVIDGKEVSLAIMILIYILAFVDSLSTVVFLPYLSRFSAQYITAYFVGEGICQLIPAVVGIIQGVGETPDCQNHTIITYNETTMMNSTSYQIVPIYPNPKFSVQAFFIMMSCVMVLSGVAFTLIHYLPYFQKKRLDKLREIDVTKENSHKLDAAKSTATTDVGDVVTLPAEPHKGPNNSDDNPGVNVEDTSNTSVQPGKNKLHRGDFVFCLVLLTWGFGLMFGFLPGLHSYSALPYGNRAYNLSIRLGIAINPIVTFLALFVYTKSKAWISFVYLLGTAAVVYHVVLACYSPHPPLKGTAEGEVVVVSTCIKGKPYTL